MKNIVFNKYYKKLRNDIFYDLGIEQFMEVYEKYKRLSMQYHFLMVANFFEKMKIPKIDVPIIALLTKILDFLRWKIYDFFMFLINGKAFNLYGVTIFCGRQRRR